MRIVINSRSGMPRLRESLAELGCVVIENVWDSDRYIAGGVEAAIFEFRTIFNCKWRFVPLALRLKRAGIPVLTWNLDAPWHMNRSKFRVNLLLKSKLLDIYATHSLQDTAWIKGTRVLYLPNAAWHTCYNLNGTRLPDLLKKTDYLYDVSFIGNLNGGDFPEHRRRALFLDCLGKFLGEMGIRYRFFDSGELSVGQQVTVIQESRINLSCLAAADSTGEMSWGMTERCFGIPACGGFILMEDRHHLGDDFDLAEEVATYRGFEDCKRKILYYLEHDAERRRILSRAHERVMTHHTYRNRAEHLLREIRLFLARRAPRGLSVAHG